MKQVLEWVLGLTTAQQEEIDAIFRVYDREIKGELDLARFTDYLVEINGTW
jgi:hypothetical protein